MSITPSVAVDTVNISTNYETPLTSITTRKTIKNSIEDNSHIPTNQNRLNNIDLKNQTFEDIIQEKNHKNVNNLDENCWIFYPTDDTYIEKFYPNSNHSSSKLLTVGTSYSGYYDYDSLLKFNISSITSDKKVFAKLYLYYSEYIHQGYEVDYSIYRVTSDWDEDNVTWNEQPSYDSIPTDTLIVPWSPWVWVEFDVTEDVRNIIDGKYVNYGWIISDDDWCSQYTPERGIKFSSKENGNFMPYLVVKESETFYVDDDNTEGPWNGTKEYPFQRIQDAIDNCLFGDTVFVYNGTYFESVIIYKDYITLIGESNKDTIIISHQERWVVLVRMRYYGATISGFTISTDSNNDEGYAGIVLDTESIKNRVTDNIIVNNIAGILLYSNNNLNDISSNTISSYNHIGIYLRLQCNRNIIFGNTIKDVDFGIYIEAEPSYNDIIYNRISNTETGIYLSNIDHYNNISNNLLKDNYYGIDARATARNNSISRNTIIKNKYGILVRGFYYSYIFRNVIDSNFCGLFITEEPGYKLEGIYIYNNNFINNLRHAKFIIDFYIGNIITWTWNENYWDNLRGSSHMIFGRTGFFFFQIIPWIMFDRHPAKVPYKIGV